MDLSKGDHGSNGPAGHPADPADGITTVEKPAARKRRDAEPTAAAWAKVLDRLRKQLGEDVYSSWFARVEFEAGDAASVMLSVPTRFLKSWIHGNYRDKLVDLWLAEGYTVRRIDIAVRSAVRPRAEAAAPVAAVEPEPRERPAPTMLAHAKAVTEAPKRVNHSGPLGGSPVDPRCSFETYCEGAANRVALAAARSVAEGSAASFNPLFLHAGVGRGKSHLLHAIAQHSRGAHAGRNVVYLTAEHFMFRFVAAIRNQSGVAFKESLREIDVLLIDDVQFLQGKSAQQEFCHLLNVLIDGARQVVVAADRPPAELESLDERVRSRLGGGVALEIGTPDLDLRKRILRTRLATAKEISPNLDIPETVIDYVAQTVATNGRDLEGALNRLVAQWQFTNVPVTIASAEVTLRDLIGTREPRRVRIEDIQKVVSRHFNVSKADLLSSRRTRTIVRPRQIAMYLSKVMTPRSLPEIGRRFGGRDHTTVLHAVRKIEELMAADRSFADEVELLRKMVEDQPIP
jgi:chromosomal replication initiator protein